MGFNQKSDARALRLIFFLASAALLASMIFVWRWESEPQWKRLQAAYDGPSLGPIGFTGDIRQKQNCAGQVDRCTTCHLMVNREDLRGESIPKLYRAHPKSMVHHFSRDIGCSQCHGGNPGALVPSAAHSITNGEGKDPLMTQAFIQASCAKCHLPGAVEGTERLASGAMTFIQLGCMVCHPLQAGGAGSADYGPDLRALGRQSLDYLRTSIVDPSANYTGSTMPSFRRTFEHRPDAMDDLLIYVQSLALKTEPTCADRDRFSGLVQWECARCHNGPSGKAQGRTSHSCPYIKARASELKCSRCHPGSIPKPGLFSGRCPVVQSHRKNCAACHDSARHARAGAIEKNAKGKTVE